MKKRRPGFRVDPISEMIMPARIKIPPQISRLAKTSPALSQANNAPKTGSADSMSAACVADVYFWTPDCMSIVSEVAMIAV